MKYMIIFLAIIFLLHLINAETTFFDNPDDAFIMGGSSTGGAIITEEQKVRVGSEGCLYKWNCTNWDECLSSGKQTRNCTNLGTCPDTYKTPEIEQNCTYTPPENEKENETGNVRKEKFGKEFVDKNRVLIYCITVLIIGFVIFYLTKDYFRKLIKKTK